MGDTGVVGIQRRRDAPRAVISDRGRRRSLGRCQAGRYDFRGQAKEKQFDGSAGSQPAHHRLLRVAPVCVCEGDSGIQASK